MNKQEIDWFKKLSDKRRKFAELSQDIDYRGMWEVLIKGIYSQDAHFIYELLQNAEDVKATSVNFILKEDGLFFIHNGTVPFTITDVDNQNENGHINAITAVGRTGKKISETIGKFGIGFKAVFQYTKSPHIYDPKFQFKIYDYIVPELLGNYSPKVDFNKQKDTVFYFPFIREEDQTDDIKVKSKTEAYKDISYKLRNLDKPNLFLSNLKEIKWQIGKESNTYKKEVIKKQAFDGVDYSRIKLVPENSEYLTFSQLNKEIVEGINLEYEYSIVYKIENNNLKPIINPCAYCFFPTSQETNLNFLFHAPFLLNSNRESIPQNQKLILKDDDNNDIVIKENFNEILIDRLAQLSVKSLFILKQSKLINDDIFKIIPYKESELSYISKPFFELIKHAFQNEELLPAKKGYTKKENAYWAQDKPVLNLFSDEQLATLIEEENAKWVFRSLVRNQTEKNEELRDYIKDCITDWYDMSEILEMIDGNFIEKQSDEWLKEFYEYLSRYKSYWQEVKEKPIFLNKNRKAVPAYDWDENLILFFHDNDGEGYETVNPQLFKKAGRKLLEKFGIREYTVADEIEDAIERLENEEIEAESFFFKAFKYFKDECPQSEIDDFIERIKDLAFIPYINKENEEGFTLGCNLYYPTEILIAFYQQRPNTNFVNIEFLNKKTTAPKTLIKFLLRLGVKNKEPDLKDKVENIILPKYRTQATSLINLNENYNDLSTIVKFYLKYSDEEVEELIEELKGLKFLLCLEDLFHYYSPQEIYRPSEELKLYFESKPDTKFIDYETYYYSLENEQERQAFNNLLARLGVSKLPRLLKVNLNRAERLGLQLENGTRLLKTTQVIIDGCAEILEDINLEKSLLLWEILGKLQHKVKSFWGEEKYYLNENLKGENHYFYRTSQIQPFESSTVTELRTKKWLLNRNGEFASPQEVSQNDLDEEYEQNIELEELLNFLPSVILTEEEKKLKTFDKLFDSVEEAEEAKRALEEKRARENPKSNSIETSTIIEPDRQKPLENAIKTLDDLQKTVPVKQHTRSKPRTNAIEYDEDEELAKGIEKLKDGLEIKKQRIEYVEDIENSIKYSYQWFRAYLELLKTYGEKQDNQKQKSISFQEIKPYKTDNKYFLLCGASSYISSDIENAEDFKISLIFGNEKRENIKVEGVSKKGQDLLIYCRESIPNNLLSKISKVFKIEVNFTPIIDLLDRLLKAFANNKNIDEWEYINEAVPPLNYIYGPPGTGKTTTLCNKIENILKANPNKKILVLTPTNKAADVVCNKLWEIDDDIFAIRLSKPTDPELEEEGIYRDTIDLDDLNDINVLASTIHRLPYFNIMDDGLLFQYNWNYVIFDEASMIGLHYITFALMALYKTNSNTKFIVAGDPKQIPPVIEIDDKELENFDFQDENIYKMMNLESFNPKEQKIRKIDSIQNLDTQYRSIPQIGWLFSELSYSGLLKHYREKENKETKSLPSDFKDLISQNVTFLNIPLDEEDSVYKINKLFYSSYQIYCAILVTEIVKYFDSTNKDEQWTIGLIAPYKAQAVLMNKLITSYGISENVKVYSDTVHGFQGDECDIVFFVCNPNNYKFTGHEKSLLSKEYIYNVAISRAKDYLVILHPYETIPNPYINNIGISYKNNFGNTRIENAKDIEKVLFNDQNFIEKNSYISGHDSINVFGLSDMKYFIKANDTAIDIQLRDLKSQQVEGFKSENEIIKGKYTDKKMGVKVVGKIDLSKFNKRK